MQSQENSSPVGTDCETHPFLATLGEKVIPFSSNLFCSSLIYCHWHSQSQWLTAAGGTAGTTKKAQAVRAGPVQKL